MDNQEHRSAFPDVLRRAGPASATSVRVQIDDIRMAGVLPSVVRLATLHAGGIHLEGPAWQDAEQRLLFSDVPNRRLLARYEDGRVEAVIGLTHFMNGNAVGPDGAVYHCEHGRRCISRSDATVDAEPVPVVTHFEGRRLNSPNDVAIAPDGAVWFTDPIFGIVMPSQGALAEPELDHRSVYRFDPVAGTLGRMADFEQPNGLAFSPDGRTLYVTDTSVSLGEVPGFEAGTKHEVVAFDVGVDGVLSDRRFFCHTDHGYPDGLAVDRRGWLWVSAADGIHIWSAARERLGFVPIGAVVSSLAFGGVDGRRLFITASTRLLAIDLLA